MPTITIELTPLEAQQLMELIDAAIRANGLPAAEAGLPLALKINTARTATPEPATDKER